MFDIRRCYLVSTNGINNVNGYLSIEVYDNVNNMPMANTVVALIRITVTGLYFEHGEGVLVGRYLTDENGKIPLITLPAISDPEVEASRQRTRYYMTFDAYGYYEVVVSDIQIYPNITTLYRVIVSPLTAQPPKYEFIYNPINP
jgi:hypothetical protein